MTSLTAQRRATHRSVDHHPSSSAVRLAFSAHSISRPFNVRQRKDDDDRQQTELKAKLQPPWRSSSSTINKTPSTHITSASRQSALEQIALEPSKRSVASLQAIRLHRNRVLIERANNNSLLEHRHHSSQSHLHRKSQVLGNKAETETTTRKNSSLNQRTKLSSTQQVSPAVSNTRLRQGTLYARRQYHMTPSCSNAVTSLSSVINGATSVRSTQHATRQLCARRCSLEKSSQNSLAQLKDTRRHSQNLTTSTSKFSLASSTSSLSLAVVKRAKPSPPSTTTTATTTPLKKKATLLHLHTTATAVTSENNKRSNSIANLRFQIKPTNSKISANKSTRSSYTLNQQTQLYGDNSNAFLNRKPVTRRSEAAPSANAENRSRPVVVQIIKNKPKIANPILQNKQQTISDNNLSSGQRQQQEQQQQQIIGRRDTEFRGNDKSMRSNQITSNANPITTPHLNQKLSIANCFVAIKASDNSAERENTFMISTDNNQQAMMASSGDDGDATTTTTMLIKSPKRQQLISSSRNNSIELSPTNLSKSQKAPLAVSQTSNIECSLPSANNAKQTLFTPDDLCRCENSPPKLDSIAINQNTDKNCEQLHSANRNLLETTTADNNINLQSGANCCSRSRSHSGSSDNQRKTMDYQDEEEAEHCKHPISLSRSDSILRSNTLGSTNSLGSSSDDQMVLGSPLVTPPPSELDLVEDELDDERCSAGKNIVEVESEKKKQQIKDIPIRIEPISDYYDLEARPFARGKFAQVKRCINKVTKECFAAKCIKKRRRLVDIRHEILLEIEALKLSYYTNRIVKLYEVFETSTEMILVLEMANGGELQRVLDDEEAICEKLVKKMVKQILEGLIQLHNNDIAHLDIKPQNLLLTELFPNGDVKLCDFGISRRITKDCEIREICGTPDYVAPEILRYDPISLATDMWSLGVLTYVLLSGYSPFGSENKQQTFCNITQATLDFPSEIFDKISPSAIDFMQKLILKEPSERMTSQQAINHSWLSSD